MSLKKVAIISQGCAANFGDGEKLGRLLQQEQSSPLEVSFQMPPEGAEPPGAFYLNVCTVKGNSGALKLLKKVQETFPQAPVYITGCAPKDFKEEALRIAPSLKFLEISLRDQKNIPAATLRENPFIGIVNIEEGCLDACAFCSTHLVKGRLRSFPAKDIVQSVASLVADGCKEIQLTGQDCGCYGFETGTNLAELVKDILVHVPGEYHLRLGMGNPRHILQYQESLLECFEDDRVYKFIHLPVQSGSPNILKAMNRKHTAEDYLRMAEVFNTRFPKFTLSTDLIVGFPGETDQDFQQTMELLKASRPTVCNITRFVPRPGTVAVKLPQPVPDSIKHQRSAELAEAFQQIAEENNSKWIGDVCTVVTEKAGYRTGTSIGRNAAYRPVAIEGEIPPGQTLSVKIEKAEPFALIGKVL